MGSLILLFAVTLSVILFASFREIRKKNLDMLERYAETYTLDPKPPAKEKPEPGREMRNPPMDERHDYEVSGLRMRLSKSRGKSSPGASSRGVPAI